MIKLLVNAPSGEQQVIEVAQTGGYFDPLRVIWDERTDGTLPAITLGGMVRNGANLEFSQARMDEHNAAIAPMVPASVSKWAAEIALIDAGLLDAVNTAINSITPSGERKRVRTLWDKRPTIDRNSQFIVSMKGLVPLTDQQVDDLFVAAQTIEQSL